MSSEVGLGSGLWHPFQIGMMHLNECLVSFVMHENGQLHLGALPCSQEAVWLISLCFWWLQPVHLQWSWELVRLWGPQLMHNKEEHQLFVGCTCCNCHQVWWYYLGVVGLVLLYHTFWVVLDMGCVVVWKVLCVCIFATPLGHILACWCQDTFVGSSTPAWCHSTDHHPNSLPVCNLFSKLKLNALHVLVQHILCQSCQQPKWIVLVG